MKRGALIFAGMLTACSGRGAPSEQNLRDALTQAGNRGAPQATLLECQRSADRPGFICDYRAPLCNRYTGTCAGERPFTGRFLYAAGKWQLIEDLSMRAAPDPATQPLPGVVLATPVPTPAATVAPPSAPAPAATQPELSDRERRIIGRWRALDARCRAAADDDDDDDACAERDELGTQLERSQLCYGPPGAFGYDRAWRACGGASGDQEDQG